jgi:RNA polymerase sigma factor (sigma-70 family)
MESSAGAATPPPEDLYLLIAQYRDDAYRLARHLVRSDAEAEDLAQTAILNALRRAEHIADPACVRSYLLTTVRNLWRNQLRSRAQRRFIGADVAELLPSDDLAPDEQVLTDLDAALALVAFESLSATSREILSLRYFEGLGFPELSRRLSISPVAARQRAHRAREELVGACMDRAAQRGVGECRPIRSRLGRYHRGLLSRKVRSEVSAHLAACAACTSCYEQLVELYGHRIVGVRSTRESE